MVVARTQVDVECAQLDTLDAQLDVDDYRLVRHALWRSVSGCEEDDDDATRADRGDRRDDTVLFSGEHSQSCAQSLEPEEEAVTSFAIAIRFGAWRVQLGDKARLGSAPLVALAAERASLSIERDSHSFRFEVRLASASAFDATGCELAAPLADALAHADAREPALEFRVRSVGTGVEDTPSGCALSVRRTCLRWRAETWWAVKAFFDFAYERDARDGARVAPSSAAAAAAAASSSRSCESGAYRFELVLAQSRVLLEAAGESRCVALDAGEVSYCKDWPAARHLGKWLAKDVSLTLLSLAKREAFSPRKMTQHDSDEAAPLAVRLETRDGAVLSYETSLDSTSSLKVAERPGLVSEIPAACILF